MSNNNKKKKKKKNTKAKKQQTPIIEFTAEEVFSMMDDTSHLISQENVTRLSSIGPAASESGTLADSVEFWSWMNRNYANSGHFASSENMRSYMSGTPGQQNWAKKVVQGKGYEWDWMSAQRKSVKNLFKTYDAGDIANRPGSDITANNIITGAEKEYQLKAYTSKNTPHLKNTPKDMAVVTNSEKVEQVTELGYKEVISYGDNEAIQTARDSRLDDMASGKATPTYGVKNVGLATAKAGMMGFVINAGVETIVSYRKWKKGQISSRDYLREIMKSGGNAGTTSALSAGVMIPVTAAITTAGISSLVTIPISFTVSAAVDKVVAPAFERGEYLRIITEATYYKSMTEMCGSMAFTIETASAQYSDFVNQIVVQQKAFNTMTGSMLPEQAFDDFEYYASLSSEEVGKVVSGMISLLQNTDEQYDSLQNQNFIKRMFKTVIGKNKATKEEIRRNYERLSVYTSKAIEILFQRQCVDEKVIQILGGEIINLCKSNVLLTAKVEALTYRVDNLTDSLLAVTVPGDEVRVVSAKQLIDEQALKKYKEAETLFLSGKLIDAFDLFKDAASNGVGRAYYYLGSYFASGFGHIKENASEALEHWRKGMELGDAASTYEYGFQKYPLNSYESNTWIRKHVHSILNLMKNEDPVAFYEYGWHLINSNPRDIDALVDSLGYFKKAAEKNYWPAAKMFFQFTEDIRQSGVSLPDYSVQFEGVEWYETQILLGTTGFNSLQNGIDELSIEKAVRHFQKSLWLRDDIVDPAAYLAFLLNTGIVKDSIGEGISSGNVPMYYSAGLSSENPMMHYQIGTFYYNGIGGDEKGKDLEKAYAHFSRSYALSKQGFTAGLLGYMTLMGEGTTEDNETAFKYLTEGHQLGNPMATRLLAVCYKEGFGVAKDEKKYDVLMAEVAGVEDQDQEFVTQNFMQHMLDQITLS